MGTQDTFPVKSTKMKSVVEERSVFWMEERGKILAWQRPPDSRLMPGFWELPEATQLPQAVSRKEAWFVPAWHHVSRLPLRGVVGRAPAEVGDCRWVAIADLARMPVSTILKKAAKLIGEDSSAC